MKKTHELKTDPGVFESVFRFDKTYQIRKDDRGFEQGDILYLRQTTHTGRAMAAGAPLIYTGKYCYARVTHILHGPIYGLKQGWVILSFKGVTGGIEQVI